MKAQIIDGNIRITTFPKDYKYILSFDKASPKVHKEHGFYDVVIPI